MKLKHASLLFSMLGLAACGDTQFAAYRIAGGGHSLTLSRQQAYIGSDWDSELIVAHMPECQHRYPLPGVAGDRIKLDVYRSDPDVFILNSAQRWYVTETKTCRFQQFKEAPPAPGELVGSFQVRDGNLEYKSQEAPTRAGAVPPVPTSPARP